MHLRNDMRQKNTQKNLDFNSTPTGEARTAGGEATESFSTRHAPENPASTNQLMEEVCERENLKRAFKANLGKEVPQKCLIPSGGCPDYVRSLPLCELNGKTAHAAGRAMNQYFLAFLQASSVK